jgi:Sec-independent protein secretion pathway component TatC
MMIMAIPLLLLYEASILIVQARERKKPADA